VKKISKVVEGKKKSNLVSNYRNDKNGNQAVRSNQ